MARIRTVKPEFWDSPSVAAASPWARLAYIAMWNWADDYGRGTANLKELEGFIFPNDTFPQEWSGNTVHFRSIMAEVAECFGVVFYEVEGRHYYAITTWEQHQRNERRAKESKYPEPPSDDSSSGNTVHVRSAVAELPTISGAGTGEQGNRGTGEQGKAREPRGHRIPDDFAPTDTNTNWATAEYPWLDLASVTAAFRDYWQAEAGAKASKLDWHKAWRVWVRREGTSTPAWKRDAVPDQPDSWDRLKVDPALYESQDAR